MFFQRFLLLISPFFKRQQLRRVYLPNCAVQGDVNDMNPKTFSSATRIKSLETFESQTFISSDSKLNSEIRFTSLLFWSMTEHVKHYPLSCCCYCCWDISVKLSTENRQLLTAYIFRVYYETSWNHCVYKFLIFHIKFESEKLY